MDKAQTLAEQYIATWNATDPAQRQRLLQQAWTADARYTDPMAQAHTPQQIDALIGAVQTRFDGFRFALTGQPDGHGAHLRFSWTLGPAAQPDLIQGTDFAEIEDGKLKSVTGFLDKVPVGA